MFLPLGSIKCPIFQKDGEPLVLWCWSIPLSVVMETDLSCSCDASNVLASNLAYVMPILYFTLIHFTLLEFKGET